MAHEVGAAHLLRTWADYPDDPERWANTAIEVCLPEGSTTRLGRPPHPLCGCQW